MIKSILAITLLTTIMLFLDQSLQGEEKIIPFIMLYNGAVDPSSDRKVFAQATSNIYRYL